MCELSSLHTQPMGVRLKEGRERMSACRLGSGSGSSGGGLTSGSSKVRSLDALSKPPYGSAVLEGSRGSVEGESELTDAKMLTPCWKEAPGRI